MFSFRLSVAACARGWSYGVKLELVHLDNDNTGQTFLRCLQEVTTFGWGLPGCGDLVCGKMSELLFVLCLSLATVTCCEVGLCVSCSVMGHLGLVMESRSCWLHPARKLTLVVLCFVAARGWVGYYLDVARNY